MPHRHSSVGNDHEYRVLNLMWLFTVLGNVFIWRVVWFTQSQWEQPHPTIMWTCALKIYCTYRDIMMCVHCTYRNIMMCVHCTYRNIMMCVRLLALYTIHNCMEFTLHYQSLHLLQVWLGPEWTNSGHPHSDTDDGMFCLPLEYTGSVWVCALSNSSLHGPYHCQGSLATIKSSFPSSSLHNKV